jgi:hypothetical protein
MDDISYSYFCVQKDNSFMNITMLCAYDFPAMAAIEQWLWLWFSLYEEEPFHVGAVMELEIEISISTY